jgi:hypothetical protein
LREESPDNREDLTKGSTTEAICELRFTIRRTALERNPPKGAN